MSRRVAPLTPQVLDRVPEPCRRCAFWELGPDAATLGSEAAAIQKEAWVSAATLEWGLAGLVVSVDGEPAGYALFGPAELFAAPAAEVSRPVSRDAALLATALIVPAFRGQGLGRVLVQSTARELVKRKVRGLEAFADRSSGRRACHLPAGFLERCGFVVVRDHHRFPLLRMNLRATVRWKGVGELALDVLRAPVTPTLRPVPGGHPATGSGPTKLPAMPGRVSS